MSSRSEALFGETQLNRGGSTFWSLSNRKRVFECVCALVLLALTIPLIAFIAAVVKLSSPGPIFFRQKRAGKSGDEFQLLKFRTMYDNSHGNGPLITRSGDRRVTPAGRWLRKWKLDELPQFFNVLRGDMGLVGHRPDMSKYIETLVGEDRNVLRFRPGITSPATVLFRNEEEVLAKVPAQETEQFYIRNLLPRKIRTDLDYMECATFSTDCWIMLRTVLSVLKRS